MLICLLHWGDRLEQLLNLERLLICSIHHLPILPCTVHPINSDEKRNRAAAFGLSHFR
jgi:hypothetical protein